MTTGAGDLLRRAAAAVDGPRDKTHGNKERSFQCIAEGWDWYLRNRRGGRNSIVTPVDVAMMMDLLKTGRFLHGEPVEDHFLDKCGYSAIAGELAAVARTAEAKQPIGVGASHGPKQWPPVAATIVEAVPALTEYYQSENGQQDRRVPRFLGAQG